MPKPDKYIVGLDIGTEKIIASLAKIARNKVTQGIFSNYTLTKGIDEKGVTNIAMLVDALKEVMTQFKNLSYDAKLNICISLDGTFVKKSISSASIPLIERGNKIINNRDIKKIISFSKALIQRLDEEIIYSYPLEFLVDDQILTKNPLGLYAHKLQIRLLCLVTLRSFLDNISYATRCAGLDVGNFIYSGLALSSHIDEGKKRDYAIIDFGKHTTDIILFKEGLLEDIRILERGSYDITRDVASKFNILLESAEELRDTVSILDARKLIDEEVMIKNVDTYEKIKKVELLEFIVFSFKSHFKIIKEVLLRYGYAKEPYEVFATGEDVFLDGFLELLSSELGLDVKMIHDTKNIMSEYRGHPNLYDCSQGAVRFAIFDYKEDSLSSRGGNILKKSLAYIKELYQEYF